MKMDRNLAWIPAVLVLVLASCANRTRATDPLTDLRNPKLGVGAREKAITKAWEMAQAGTIDRMAVREDLKNVAWSRHWAVTLRLAALNALLSDTDEKGREDTRNMVRLMLPRESEPRVTQALAAAADRSGWQETSPALVRSLSVPWAGIADRDRPEAAALAKLNPGVPLERVVYRVFQNPPDDGGVFGLVPPEKMRADAWTLLRRLDSDGTKLAGLVAEDSGSPADILKAGLSELRVMPGTGDELAWLISLRDGKSPAHREWWTQTAAAVASLDVARAGRLQLRYLEPIRWAAAHKSEWLAMSRPQLLAEAQSRLDGRKTHRRTARDPGAPKPPSEKIQDWRNSLMWGDLLTILVVDESLRHREIAATLFAQAAMDQDDRTAEYGGVLRTDAPEAFSVVLFPPRPGSRRGDNEFVASNDMFAQSDHALAHYHFHAQDSHNSAYAGPSQGDLAYAARYGRTCVVFTWTSSNVLDADLYTPEGVVLDLGEVVKP